MPVEAYLYCTICKKSCIIFVQMRKNEKFKLKYAKKC